MEIAEKNLADFIQEARKSISDEWENTLYAGGLISQNDTPIKFAPYVESLLEAIAHTPLQSPPPLNKPGMNFPCLNICAERYAVEQLTDGLTIAQLTFTLQALRTIVLRLWMETCEKRGVSAIRETLELDRAFSNALNMATEHYSYIKTRCEALFLRMLAHDLRNAVSGLELTPQLLQQDSMFSPEKMGKIASTIARSVDSTVRIIGKIADLGNVHEGIGITVNPVKMELGTLCEEALEKLRLRHPDHTVLFENMDTFTGFFDRRRIMQVFTNLIGNALLHGIKNEPVIIKMRMEMDELIFSVWNLCNPACSQETRLMFNPMQRYAAQVLSSRDPLSSLGIGLYISQEIVHAHGGTMSAIAENNWITFEVRLPLLKPKSDMQ